MQLSWGLRDVGQSGDKDQQTVSMSSLRVEKQGRQGSWQNLTVQSPTSLQIFSSKLQLFLMAEEVLIPILKTGKLTLEP